MRNKIFASFIIILILYSSALAPSSDDTRMSQIKSNPLYHWAVGEAKEREEALQIADQELIEQIGGVFLASSTVWIRQEKNTGGESEYVSDFKDQIKRCASLYLKGLMHSAIRKQEAWIAISYIHKDSLEVSFQLRKTKIREFYRQALYATEKGQVSEIMRNSYWGFLLSHAFPETLHFQLPNLDISEYPKIAFMSLLKTTLADIKISADDCYRDGPEIMAPLRCFFHGKPVNELSFQYYSGGGGMDWGLFEDGTADIPFYDEPSSPTRRLLINIEYAYRNSMSMDEEIEGLFEIFKKSSFNNGKCITLSFPWVKAVELGNMTVSPLSMEKNRESITKEKKEAIQYFKKRDEPPLFREALELFCEITEISEFQDFINQYVKLRVLTVGRPDDFGDGAGCYIAIIEGQQMRDVVYYSGNNYRSIKTGIIFSELNDSLFGKDQLWFKAVEVE